MKKVIILKGLPASGKTTWAKEKIAENPGQYKRINKDDLRAMLDNGEWSKTNEKFVLSLRDDLIIKSLEAGKHVIIDDTNLNPIHERRIRNLVLEWSGDKNNGKVEVLVFTFYEVSVEDCIKRDGKRQNPVGRDVIMDMYNKYLKPEPAVYTPPEGKPKAIIVDIDGTIALMNGKRGPYEWDKVGGDDVNKPVLMLLECFLKGFYSYTGKDFKVLFVSGRDAMCITETEKWLLEKTFAYHLPYYLFMRPEGDNRKDTVIKKEIFDNHIRDHYDVQFVLDDRNQVVEMWRSLGLTCLQVADGDF